VSPIVGERPHARQTNFGSWPIQKREQGSTGGVWSESGRVTGAPVRAGHVAASAGLRRPWQHDGLRGV